MTFAGTNPLSSRLALLLTLAAASVSRQSIPGGVVFENFEMRERFREASGLSSGSHERAPRSWALRRHCNNTLLGYLW